jgi:hypothetical protein
VPKTTPRQLSLLKPKPHLIHVVQHVLKPTAIQNSTFALLSLIGLTRKPSKDIKRLETSHVFLALQLRLVGLGPWTQDSSHRLGPPGQLKAVEKILRHHGPMDPDSSDVALAYQFTEQNFMRVNLERPQNH